MYSLIDVDECKLGTHNCHINGFCHNTNGSFYCSCIDGYSGSGVFCAGRKLIKFNGISVGDLSTLFQRLILVMERKQ